MTKKLNSKNLILKRKKNQFLKKKPKKHQREKRNKNLPILMMIQIARSLENW
jgi:hypothetical protein